MTIIDDLKPLEDESLDRGIPIIGHEKGTWLLYKVKELKPKKVLEFGTATGYSACILGSEGAIVTTIELDPERAKEAEENFQKLGIAAKVKVDDGVAYLKELLVNRANLESFDLIFIDFAKNLYNEVLDGCMKLVRVGGLIIADNISFEGCQDFKQRIFDHSQLGTELVNIKDGLSCSERLL